MRISVALCTYNGEKFLQEQLQSIASQSMLPHELVVVDDCSTDGTINILNAFSRKAPFPVKVYRNETNLGFTENFLKAASLCSGDIVAFSDQDDVWLEHKIFTCARFFDSKSVVLVVHSGRVVDECLSPLGWNFPDIKVDRIATPLSLEPWRGFSGFAMLFRRNIPGLLGWGRPHASIDMDEPMLHDQWVHFLSTVFGDIALVSSPLVLYRRHAQTVTNPRGIGLTESLAISLHASHAEYKKLEELSAQRALVLHKISNDCDVLCREAALKGMSYYRSIAVAFKERAELYRERKSVFSRLKLLLSMLWNFRYRARTCGGFGFMAFIKDLALCLVPKSLFRLG